MFSLMFWIQQSDINFSITCQFLDILKMWVFFDSSSENQLWKRQHEDKNRNKNICNEYFLKDQ